MLHDSVPFDHADEVYDVKITLEFELTLLVVVFQFLVLCGVLPDQAPPFTIAETVDRVDDQVFERVLELLLVDNQVVYRVELLIRRPA